ncbi:MAG: hypothetical protein J6U18_00845, partial [Acetobacter sp.]|nr:hypothetical protein [Acetobacter sp.]
MLGLKLREEFQGDYLKGTAIELATNNQDGATQIAAGKFLEITYPTRDLLQAIEAVSSKNLKEEKGRPVVVIGERGSGKSHLMAALYHVVQTPDLAQKWLDHWAARYNDACIKSFIKSLTLRQEKMHVICENMNDHNYNALWDVLFN